MNRSSDIHQSSKDSSELKRYYNHKAKWAYGTRPLPGRARMSDSACRPALHGANRLYQPSITRRRLVGRRKAGLRDDVHDGMTTHQHADSSPSPETEFTAADDPNVFYSFDAMRAPGHGEHILGVAISRALDRFETKETEKVVREYEFVYHNDGGDSTEETSADEDGYEVVDYPKM